MQRFALHNMQHRRPLLRGGLFSALYSYYSYGIIGIYRKDVGNMMVSTKGRYALRIMLDLAQQDREAYVSLKAVADRQDISMKYLEAIVSTLHKAGLVESRRGKEGGYRLRRPPENYTAGEILQLTEGSLAPVACMECGAAACGRADICLTLPLWKELDSRIDGYLQSVTLADLLAGRVGSA